MEHERELSVSYIITEVEMLRLFSSTVRHTNKFVLEELLIETKLIVRINRNTFSHLHIMKERKKRVKWTVKSNVQDGRPR